MSARSAPRSAFLAAGGILAAVLACTGPAGQLLVAVGSLGACAAAVVSATRPGPARRAEGAVRTAALGIGAAAVLVRVLVAGTGAPPPGPSVLPSGEGPWRGVVAALATPRDGTHALTVALDPSGIRVRVTAPLYPAVVAGDVVEAQGPLQAPPEGDFGTWLRQTGVSATLRAPTLRVLPTSWSPQRMIEGFRAAAGDALARALPEPSAGLAAGILIGLRERVDPDLAAAFTATGLSHVVAISGWNIALVAGLAGSLLAGRPRRPRAAVTLIAIGTYAILAGASPSVLRAAVMAGVALSARELGRPGSAARALGWAVLLLLVVTPASIADAGFQLSAAATAGLLAWASPLGAALRQRMPWAPAFIVEGLAVSLAAQAATLPIVLAAFGRLAILSPVLNLVVVPLVPVAMAAGAVAMIGGLLAAAGAPALILPLGGLAGATVLGVLVAIVRLAAGLPFASVTLPDGAGAVLGVLAAGALAMFIGRGHLPGRRRPKGRRPTVMLSGSAPGRAREKPPGRRSRAARALVAALAFGLAAAALAGATRADGLLHVIVFDVGQGDAILVRTAHDARVLVDGGPDPGRLLGALDARLPPWDRRLDLVVLTHPHDDHAAGLAGLGGRYRIGRVVEPGMRGSGPGYAGYLATLRELGLSSGRLATGDRVEVDGLRLQVLWPDPGTVPAEPATTGTGVNDTSIVMLGEWAGRRFLLMGDAEEDVDPILVARGLPRVDLLKVAHHGSRTASSEAFLAATRPAVAVISVGAHNEYGHPAAATLGRLMDHGAAVHRTDLEGTVDVTVATDGLVVRTARSATTPSAPAASVSSPSPTAVGPAPRAPRPLAPGLMGATGEPMTGRLRRAAARSERRTARRAARRRRSSPIIGSDVRSESSRGGSRAARPAPTPVAPSTLVRRGRGCRVAGVARGGPGGPGGSPAGRGRRAPP